MANSVSTDSTSAFPDLYRVLSRMPNDADRLRFLENLYHRIKQRDLKDVRVQPLLKQLATSLSPVYEQHRRWRDAATLFEEAGYFTEALTDYLRVDASADAARCAEKSGDFNAALQLYIQANRLFEAADAAKALGDKEQAQALYLKAIDHYVSQKEFRQAADAAEKAGMVKKALELQAEQIDHVGYTDSKYMYQELVERALQSEDVALALDLALRGDLFESAITIALKNKDYDTIPSFYKKYLDSVYPKERLPIFRRYLEFLTEHGSQTATQLAYKQEVDFLKTKNEYLAAAELASEVRMPESADLYRMAMQHAEAQADFAKAALAATKLGLNEEADYYRNLASLLG